MNQIEKFGLEFVDFLAFRMKFKKKLVRFGKL